MCPTNRRPLGRESSWRRAGRVSHWRSSWKRVAWRAGCRRKAFAAFVLKYRIPEKKGEGIPKDLNMDDACKYGIADGIQAVKVVRQHAAEWGISPERVGFMGFSAGAMVATGVLL